MWDYPAIIAKIVPNRYYLWIVTQTQGWETQGTFPVAYKVNTKRAVARYAAGAGFEAVSFQYWANILHIFFSMASCS
jgi:hypothetical protein